MLKYGNWTDEQALRLVTLNPAIQLRLDNRIGSIDVGKDADLVIFNGHPFSVYSSPDMTFIEGEVFFDRAQDLKNRELIAKEKKELIEKEKKANVPTQPMQSAPTFIPTEDDLDHDAHPFERKSERKKNRR